MTTTANCHLLLLLDWVAAAGGLSSYCGLLHNNINIMIIVVVCCVRCFMIAVFTGALQSSMHYRSVTLVPLYDVLSSLIFILHLICGFHQDHISRMITIYHKLDTVTHSNTKHA